MADFKQSLEHFLDHISLSHTGSKDTTDAYRRDIQHFLNYLQEENISSFETVTKETLSNYLTALKQGDITGNPLSNASYARHLSSLKSFYRYLNRHEEIKNNPVRMFHGNTNRRKLPDYLNFDQVETVLNQFDLNEPIQVRDRCMLETIYACGLRVSECAGLLMKDVNLHEHYLSIIGKESKQRYVPFYARCGQLLDYYIHTIRPQLMKEIPEHGYVFVNAKGKPITSRSIQNICEKAGQNANLPIRLHPHMLRHTFATNMLDHGADLRVVQELLGHENLSTTQIYTHVTLEHLQKEVEKAHPHAHRQTRPSSSKMKDK